MGHHDVSKSALEVVNDGEDIRVIGVQASELRKAYYKRRLTK